MELTEQALWQAVEERDGRYDGICFYAVTTTGIYCRLHCASRKPLRRNTRFFFSREGAEGAGFRPCKRCRPDKTGAAAVNGRLSKVIAVCRHIEGAEDIPKLADLARRVDLSPSHLQRIFKQTLGLSPRNYADAHRQKRLRGALRNGEEIALATYEAGYGSSSRLYEKAERYLGMTPKAYQRKGKDQTISYAVLQCSLGQLLLATTAKGICAVHIGDSRAALVAMLKKEFSRARFVEAKGELAEWPQLLIDYLAGRGPWPELPYDIRATAFQRMVWDYLRTIPEGGTVHYAEVAAALGRPRAARAVARACAGNPAALVIPCHRVVPKAGGVGGYRWGAQRKQRLLELEKHNTAGLRDK
jgi:AraC family transcriptional regulator, regulatory protein of adaptative response / methylated-DNA-[protein]-cysteine methyltransferase